MRKATIVIAMIWLAGVGLADATGSAQVAPSVASELGADSVNAPAKTSNASPTVVVPFGTGSMVTITNGGKNLAITGQVATSARSFPWQGVAELLSALARVLWPALWLLVVFLFRKELGELLQKLRLLRLFGNEVDLGGELTKLEEQASTAAADVPGAAEGQGLDDRISKQTHTEDQVLVEAGRSPRAALMLLSADIERELRFILLATNWASQMPRRTWTVQDAIPVLVAQGTLPGHIGNAVRSFVDVRNKIVHGGTAEEGDVLRAVDAGLTVLRTLRAIPIAIPTIAALGIQLFSDEAGRQPVSGVTGILIEHVDPRGRIKESHVRPTRRTDYSPGMHVSWEWDMTQVVGPMWYRDSTTGEMVKPWESSALFNGRDMDEA